MSDFKHSLVVMKLKTSKTRIIHVVQLAIRHDILLTL